MVELEQICRIRNVRYVDLDKLGFDIHLKRSLVKGNKERISS